MGLWCSLAITFGLGPDDPGSNPGNPTFYSNVIDNAGFKVSSVQVILFSPCAFTIWVTNRNIDLKIL